MVIQPAMRLISVTFWLNPCWLRALLRGWAPSLSTWIFLYVVSVIECSWVVLLIQISLLVADDMFGQIPPLEKDLYFGEPPPDALPYTKSAARAMSQPHLGSTADLRSDSNGRLSVFLSVNRGCGFHHRCVFVCWFARCLKNRCS